MPLNIFTLMFTKTQKGLSLSHLSNRLLQTNKSINLQVIFNIHRHKRLNVPRDDVPRGSLIIIIIIINNLAQTDCTTPTHTTRSQASPHAQQSRNKAGSARRGCGTGAAPAAGLLARCPRGSDGGPQAAPRARGEPSSQNPGSAAPAARRDGGPGAPCTQRRSCPAQPKRLHLRGAVAYGNPSRRARPARCQHLRLPGGCLHWWPARTGCDA